MQRSARWRAPRTARDPLRRHAVRPIRSRRPGEHWEKVELPDHGLPVWSILFTHTIPSNPLGCENCEIYRSDDAASTGRGLPVAVAFRNHDIAGRQPSKRVLRLDASAGEPELLYAAIEVGAPSARPTAASIGRI